MAYLLFKKHVLLIRYMIFILAILTFSGCSSIQGYFKHSANQSLIDFKGFQGKKRTPMYNKKYIAKAKNNIATSNLRDQEEDDYNSNPYYEKDEIRNYYQSNRKMYDDMVEMNNNKKYWNKNFATKGRSDVSLTEIDEATKKKEENQQIKMELAEIKKMLKKTMDDMSNAQVNEALKKQPDNSALLNSVLAPQVINSPCSIPSDNHLEYQNHKKYTN